MPNLNRMKRNELNDHARGVGIAEPTLYPTNDALVEAIEDQSSTGRPNRIDKDIARTKRAREEEAAPDQPEAPVPVPPTSGALFGGHRVRSPYGEGTLIQHDRGGIWTVELDDGTSIQARAHELERV